MRCATWFTPTCTALSAPHKKSDLNHVWPVFVSQICRLEYNGIVVEFICGRSTKCRQRRPSARIGTRRQWLNFLEQDGIRPQSAGHKLRQRVSVPQGSERHFCFLQVRYWRCACSAAYEACTCIGLVSAIAHFVHRYLISCDLSWSILSIYSCELIERHQKMEISAWTVGLPHVHRVNFVLCHMKIMKITTIWSLLTMNTGHSVSNQRTEIDAVTNHFETLERKENLNKQPWLQRIIKSVHLYCRKAH